MADGSFLQKKIAILAQLNIPEKEYTDLSPKGSVDEGVRGLINDINSVSGFVTTSSCAGRVSVFLEGRKKSQQDDLVAETSVSQQAIAGPTGKGGGRWLFVSHDPLKACSDYSSEFELSKVASVPPKFHSQLSLVHFKFEPMILHVLTCTMDDASKLLKAALQAGFRESGLMNVSGHPMVAVRSTGLAFDSIIGFENDSGDAVRIVDELHLQLLVSIANQRFNENTDRIKRFQTAFLPTANPTPIGWEDPAARKERKKREGLAKQQELQRRQTQSDASGDEGDSAGGMDNLFV